MKRIAPTERVRKQIEELLEAERTDAPGREPYERKSDTRSWRNGYEPKTWRTSEGKVPMRED